MMTALASVSEIAARCGVTAETGHTLAEFTTIGVGGPVACLLKPDTIEAMGKLLAGLREAGFSPRLLGGGANLVGGPDPITHRHPRSRSVSPRDQRRPGSLIEKGNAAPCRLRQND